MSPATQEPLRSVKALFRRRLGFDKASFSSHPRFQRRRTPALPLTRCDAASASEDDAPQPSEALRVLDLAKPYGDGETWLANQRVLNIIFGPEPAPPAVPLQAEVDAAWLFEPVWARVAQLAPPLGIYVPTDSEDEREEPVPPPEPVQPEGVPEGFIPWYDPTEPHPDRPRPPNAWPRDD